MSQGPSIACPGPQTGQALSGDSAVVTYPAATVTGGAAPVVISCVPPSGSTFPLGTSTVACTVHDGQQQSSACTFPVTVLAVPRISATRLVAFGNSITEGKLASGVIISNTYPAVLQAMLASRYSSQSIAVVNEGCGGEAAATGDGVVCPDGLARGGVLRLPGALTLNNAQVLLLEEGINDLLGGDASRISPMIDALGTMVRQARARGVQVFLGTLLPERPGGSRAGALPLITTANEQIRQLAAAEGAVLVDLYQGFGGSPDPYIDTDGLHPNETGYQKMAQIFFDAIRARLEVASGPAEFQLVNLFTRDPERLVR